MLRKLLTLSISLFIGVIFLPNTSYASGQVPITDGFDFPLGRPNGDGYGVQCCGGLNWLERYDYEGDGKAEYHPGEDWNSSDGSDAGDPVYAVSDGLVVFASFVDAGWGNVVLIEHRLADGSRYWSQYAHLKDIDTQNIQKMGLIGRGTRIGWVGDFWHGSGVAFHLHFEIRKEYRAASAFVYDWPASKVEQYYVNPSEFIKSHRPVPPPEAQKLKVDAAAGGFRLSWDKASDKRFQQYSLYRAEAKGAIENGEIIATVKEADTLEYFDKDVYSGVDYYYSIRAGYGSGLSVNSNEVSIRNERAITNISNKPGVQRYVGIDGDTVYWEDMVREQTAFPQKRTFYYYDTVSGQAKNIVIGVAPDNLVQGPYKPQISGHWLCYYGKKRTGSYDIFCRNLESEMSADIQITNTSTDENDPRMFGSTVVWQGYEGGVRRIYWTDLEGPAQINRLTETPGQQYLPQIFERQVVWTNQEALGKPLDLRSRNLETGAENVLVNNLDSASSGIWGEYYYYQKDGRLYVSQRNGKVIMSVLEAANAKINDGKVVYAKRETDGTFGIYVYIIKSGKSLKVAGPFKFQPSPAISGNIVAFDDSPDGSGIETDIYLTRL